MSDTNPSTNTQGPANATRFIVPPPCSPPVLELLAASRPPIVVATHATVTVALAQAANALHAAFSPSGPRNASPKNSSQAAP